MARKAILITGCQRSGTTLMNLILDSHPSIASIDEDRFLLPFIHTYLGAPLAKPVSFIAFKLPRYAHLVPMMDLLPNRKILWCIRNPLDVVCSMVNLRLGDNNQVAPWPAHSNGGWGEILNSYYALDDEQRRAFESDMVTFNKLTQKFSTLPKSPDNEIDIERNDSVFLAALCWKIKNFLPLLYKARNIDFHVSKYEDLVATPRETIAEILDYIGADWSDEVLMHHTLHEGKSIGNTSNTRAIDQNSVGLGKKNLSREEQDIVKRVCGEIATKWGYTLS